MTDEEMKEVIESALTKHSKISNDEHKRHHDFMDNFIESFDMQCQTHELHHEFLEVFIEDAKIRKDRWEMVKRQVYGWGIITVLATIGAYFAQKFGFNFLDAKHH